LECVTWFSGRALSWPPETAGAFTTILVTAPALMGIALGAAALKEGQEAPALAT
jgi:hypothetical protein